MLLNYKYRLYPTPQRCRDTGRVRIIEEAGSDAAHALRLLARSPGFTATVVLSLALGIGTNTAMYSLVKQVILDLLPVPNPAEIVWITKSSLHHPEPISSFSVPLLRDLQRARDLPFDGIAGADGISRLTMITGSSAEPVRGEIVTGNYFEVLGVRPALGRMFSVEDDKLAGAHPVAVLSYNFWKRRFAANPAVLNSIIRLNGYPFTIVGVSAATFDGLSPGYSPDIRVPLLMKEVITRDPSTPMLTSRDSSWIGVFGRLRPGASPDQAAVALAPLQANDNRLRGASQQMHVLPARQSTDGYRGRYNRALWVLAAVVAAVLLIACFNVAHLLLARGAKREPEFWIRVSLGASRLRLVRQVLTEGTVLGLVGGLAALPFALVFGRVVLRLAIDDPAHATLHAMPDGSVLAFNFGLAMATAVAFGLIPALRASRPDLAHRGRGLRTRALISVQVAISFVLLATAGLFLRSLDALRNVDPGFRTAGLLQSGLDPGGYEDDRISRFYTDVLGQVRSIPGVQSAALGRQPVIAGSGWSSGIKIEGYVPRQDDDANRDAVSAAYFSTLGVPLQMGREFTEADTVRAPKVAIINEEFARRYFAGRNPLGLRIGPGGRRSPEYTIVGVTRNARYKSLRETTTPFWYVPLEQIEDGHRPRAMTLFVRTAKHPEWLAGSIRWAVAQVDRNVALFDVRTLEAQVDENARRERLLATLSTFFGIVAALLAGTGLFGVLSWSVARQRREIGIRMAIGAGPFQAAWLVVRNGVGYVAAGVLAGLAATLALTSLVQALLFGVPPNDVISLAGATLVTLAIAVVATVLPARAAARVQPASTLRAD